MKIDPRIASLPLGHLRFEGRHVGRVIDQCTTIGDLVSAYQSLDARARAWTPRMQQTVERALHRLSEITGERGFQSWDEFRKTQPRLKPVRGASVYFASEAFSRVAAAELDRPPGALHLRNRTVSLLQRAGVKTLLDLLQRSHVGMPMPRAAFVSACDIMDALEALVSAITSDGTIDWLSFARTRGVVVLPEQASALHTGHLFKRQLVEQITAAVGLQHGAPGLLILQNRLLHVGGAPLTLEQVGIKIGTTKEYVRALEESIIKMLRRAIWFTDYRNCRFRFRDELLHPLHGLAAILESSGKMCFSESDWIRLLSGPAERARRVFKADSGKAQGGGRTPNESQAISLWQWHQILNGAFGLGAKEIRAEERLILELVGFRSLREKKGTIRPLMVPQTKPTKAFRTALREIKRLLGSSPPEGYRIEEIDAVLRAKLGPVSPDGIELLALLNSLPGLDPTAPMGRYRARLSHLKRRADRFERILRTHGKPMHYHELAKEAGFVPRNRKASKPYQVISTQLGEDPRFVHVGRTGLWGLASWSHVETRTVADSAAHVLSAAGRVLTEAELYVSVSGRRPVSQSFLASELVRDSRFVRVAPATWALAGKIPAPWKAWVRPAPVHEQRTGSA